jgi:hypothetical protein
MNCLNDRFFSNLVGEEGPGVKDSSVCFLMILSAPLIFPQEILQKCFSNIILRIVRSVSIIP